MEMKSRVEIDTRSPFQSAQEAILLFGERVLARQIYANKITEVHSLKDGNGPSSDCFVSPAAAELEETRQKLRKSREETRAMAEYCLSDSIQELAETKKQLERWRRRRRLDGKRKERTEITEIEFVEKTKLEYSAELDQHRRKDKEHCIIFFPDDPSSLCEFPGSDASSSSNIMREERVHCTDTVLSSMRKKKKRATSKPLMPFLRNIFPHKKVSEKEIRVMLVSSW